MGLHELFFYRCRDAYDQFDEEGLINKKPCPENWAPGCWAISLYSRRWLEQGREKYIDHPLILINLWVLKVIPITIKD